MESRLRSWQRAWTALGTPAPEGVFESLLARWSEPHRRYHTLQNIDEGIAHLEPVLHLAERPGDVEIALWFHDAIYVPGDPANERQSAALFLTHAAGTAPAFRRRVCALVLTTRSNRTPRSNDCKFIDDIDLAGFGASWDDFMYNGGLLRREFAAQSDADYYRGLSSFIHSLKRRPRFFRTEWFARRYEKQAQDNLTRLLAEIAAARYAAR